MEKSTFVCEFTVDGMHCAACEVRIEKSAQKIHGVEHVDANLASHKVVLELDKGTNTSEVKQQINKLLEKEGYKLLDAPKKKKFPIEDVVLGSGIAAFILFIFILLQRVGIFSYGIGGDVSLPTVFLLGVMASVSSCMAVIGGLVLTVSSKFSKDRKVFPIVSFHILRLVAFFVLGGVIGLLGSVFAINRSVLLGVNAVLITIMILLGIDMLDIFPFVAQLKLHMPKSIVKTADSISERGGVVSAGILGILTFFLPCGFTQTVQVYALQRADMLQSALIMGTFALGTFPVLAGISAASHWFLKLKANSLFYKVSGFLIIFFALLNLVNILAAQGIISPLF